MAKDDKHPASQEFANEEDYELLPHREIAELKDELHKLKRFDITPSKKLHVTMVELNAKLDKLLAIFEEAMHEVKFEGGTAGLEPLMNDIKKLTDQNAEIAAGTLLLVDLVKELKEKFQEIAPPEGSEASVEERAPFEPGPLPPPAGRTPGRITPPPALPGGMTLPPPAGRPDRTPAGMPPLPPPRRRKGLFS